MSIAGPDIAGLRFIKRLGEGGYSDVFLYERRSPTMNLAVKVLKSGRLSPAELTQFEAEAETMAELADHPNIVQVFSADRTSDGRPFLTMKYYPRPNMGLRAAAERFSVAEVLSVGIKIASAVETAHRFGILHRDIKPANILGDQYGEPGLTDFGIAGRATDTDGDSDVGVSVPWSAPEVLSGESNGSIAADVYGLSATLWHLLVSRSAFEIPGGDNTQYALVQRICTTTAPATGRADVPASLERLLAQGLSRRAELRPRSALEFAQALQEVEQGQRLARTKIMVQGLDGPAAPASGKSVADVDLTRAKAPTRLDPQIRPARGVPPSMTPRQPDAVITGAPAQIRRTARERVMPELEEDSNTARRPGSASVPEELPLEVGRGLSSRAVIVSVSVVILVVVVVGVLLASRGGGGSPQNTPTIKATDQTEALAAPPVPVVSASSDTATQTVHFTWTDASRERGGSYVWQYETGGQLHRTKAAGVVLPLRGARTVCIQVAYVPASDGSPTGFSQPPTCGGGA